MKKYHQNATKTKTFLRVAKVVYRFLSRIPIFKGFLEMLRRKYRKSDFSYSEIDALNARITFLESALAGIDERLQANNL